VSEHRRVGLYKRLMNEIECEKPHKRTVSQEPPKELYSRLLWEEERSPRHPREPARSSLCAKSSGGAADTLGQQPDSFLKHLTSDCARKTSCLFCRFSSSSRLQEYRKIWVATLSDLFGVKCFLVPLREQSTLEEEQGFDCKRISLVSQRR
jgi:hypothetical protein